MLNKFQLGIRTEFPVVSEMTLSMFLLSYMARDILRIRDDKLKHQPSLKNIKNALYPESHSARI